MCEHINAAKKIHMHYTCTFIEPQNLALMFLLNHCLTQYNVRHMYMCIIV